MDLYRNFYIVTKNLQTGILNHGGFVNFIWFPGDARFVDKNVRPYFWHTN
jgi:hypothetical protein